MASRRVPSLRLHASGQGRVTLNGRDFLLGPFNAPETIQKYHQLIAEWEASGRSPSFQSDPNRITIAEVVAAYLERCKTYYGNGPNSELHRIKPATDGIVEIYGQNPAVEFGPIQFKSLRNHFMKPSVVVRADGSKFERPRSRTYVNRLANQIRRMFKWAASEELLPGSIYANLATVDPLKRGRTTAHETEPVLAVAESVVEATLPFMSPVVAAMVRFQQLTGCRPGEVCSIKPCMVDRSGDVWEIQFDKHKTAYAGKKRVVFVGPKAQAILAPFLLRDENSNCFSPRESEAKRLAVKSENRVTPESCGNRPGTNKKKKPGRSPGCAYSTQSYGRAVRYACLKAFPAPDGTEGDAIKAWNDSHSWAPNQLRHSMATMVRKSDGKNGLEAASVLLGHSELKSTQQTRIARRNRQ